MNSYPFLMNYRSFYRFYIVLSYDIIVYSDKSKNHWALYSYSLSGIFFPYKSFIVNNSMNSYLFLMNYRSFYSSYIALSNDIIVYSNKSKKHWALWSYILCRILFQYKSFIVNNSINSYQFLMNYRSLYSFCIAFSYDVIVYSNKSKKHWALWSYISSRILFQYKSFIVHK